jgi:hypothetical protein
VLLWFWKNATLASALAAMALAAAPCFADDPASFARQHTQAARSSIATLDVQHLLDQHPALRRRNEEIEAGATLAEATTAQRRREIGRLSERLATLRAGSAEHARLDLKLIGARAELRGEIARAREKLAGRDRLPRRAAQGAGRSRS